MMRKQTEIKTMLFKNDIQAATFNPFAKVRGMFGVFDADGEALGFWNTWNEAFAWINSWVFEGRDVSQFTIRRV
jgi:hypothetical protein